MLVDTVDAVEGARSRGGLRGLLIATFAFIMVFAASAVPIPLYSEYKGSIGLTDADISANSSPSKTNIYQKLHICYKKLQK